MEFSWSFFTPTLIWFIIGLILLLLELGVPGVFLVFFGVGAWLVAALTFFVDISLNLQLFLFLFLSVLLLVTLRRKVVALFQGFSEKKVNLAEETDEFIGQEVVALTDISQEKDGKVELHGVPWAAKSTEKISKGDKVIISKKDNLTLFVKKA